MRRSLLVLLLLGCGPSEHLVGAQQTTSITAGVIADADATLATAGDEVPAEARDAYRRAAGWQQRTESMVEVWESRGSGERGYRLYAGCLRAALEELRDAWAEAQLTEPSEIAQAIALLDAGSAEACADPDD